MKDVVMWAGLVAIAIMLQTAIGTLLASKLAAFFICWAMMFCLLMVLDK